LFKAYLETSNKAFLK